MVSLAACSEESTRLEPDFQVVEDLTIQTEGFLDLGLEVGAKIHNYGAAGTRRIKFSAYTGYFTRRSERGNVFTWENEFTHVETVFLEAGQTKALSHVFKEITRFDTGVRGGVQILR